jgi:hypothetical protein
VTRVYGTTGPQPLDEHVVLTARLRFDGNAVLVKHVDERTVRELLG